MHALSAFHFISLIDHFITHHKLFRMGFPIFKEYKWNYVRDSIVKDRMIYEKNDGENGEGVEGPIEYQRTWVHQSE